MCQGVLGITIPTQNLINCRIFLVWFWFIFKYPVFAHWLDNFSETSLIEIRLIVIVQGFNVSLIMAASGAGMAQGWCSGVFSSHQVFLWVLQFSSLCKNPHLKFQSTWNGEQGKPLGCSLLNCHLFEMLGKKCRQINASNFLCYDNKNDDSVV